MENDATELTQADIWEVLASAKVKSQVARDAIIHAQDAELIPFMLDGKPGAVMFKTEANHGQG